MSGAELLEKIERLEAELAKSQDDNDKLRDALHAIMDHFDHIAGETAGRHGHAMAWARKVRL